LWTLAHESLRQGDLLKAKELLSDYYRLFPREDYWYTAGRSGYWLGRVEERLGAIKAAAQHYEEVIGASPMSYYMVLAYNRLVSLDRPRAGRLISRLAPFGEKMEMRFHKSLLAEYPGLAAGIELLRLGLVSQAKDEFDQLLADPYPPRGIHWITASLLRGAGRYYDAREVASQADTGWKRRYPSGQDLVQWTLAYPAAYREEVEVAASQSGVSKGLIWAVMREESGFNPEVESWANAIGLMQLILPTAKAVGRRFQMQVTSKDLRRPDVNIALGAAYLAHLRDKLGNHPVLMAAGYNAGEGAVIKWLTNGSSSDLDMFVEEIPYDQTRGYTKRVIGTMAAYLFLYGENRQLIEIDMTLSCASRPPA
jgi:soluble lytic murein transglycosylase